MRLPGWDRTAVTLAYSLWIVIEIADSFEHQTSNLFQRFRCLVTITMTGGLNILASVDGVLGGWFPATSNHRAGIMAPTTDSQMDAQTITNLHRSFEHNPLHKAVNHDSWSMTS